MCRYFNFDKLLSENLEKISESPELHASNMVSGPDSSKDQNEKIGILHSRVFNILFFFARKGEFKVSQKAMISLGLYTKVFKLTNNWHLKDNSVLDVHSYFKEQN